MSRIHILVILVSPTFGAHRQQSDQQSDHITNSLYHQLYQQQEPTLHGIEKFQKPFNSYSVTVRLLQCRTSSYLRLKFLLQAVLLEHLCHNVIQPASKFLRINFTKPFQSLPSNCIASLQLLLSDTRYVTFPRNYHVVFI